MINLQFRICCNLQVLLVCNLGVDVDFSSPLIILALNLLNKRLSWGQQTIVFGILRPFLLRTKTEHVWFADFSVT